MAPGRPVSSIKVRVPRHNAQRLGAKLNAQVQSIVKTEGIVADTSILVLIGLRFTAFRADFVYVTEQFDELLRPVANYSTDISSEAIGSGGNTYRSVLGPFLSRLCNRSYGAS